MSRGYCLVFAACALFAQALLADDAALWKEYGLQESTAGYQGKLAYTVYRMKDRTGAIAAWEWQRSPSGKTCTLADLCTADGTRTVVADSNYVVIFDGLVRRKAEVDAVIQPLPNKQETAVPAILTFVPRSGLVPDSARYVLGPASLVAFAPNLAGTKPGFAEGAEAQVADYKLENPASPARLAVFYYPTPEMARQHSLEFKKLSNVFVKRSGVLVALVFGGATQGQADTLLSRVQYEAKITWNDTPPPPPIKPLYQLLLNILYMCVLLGVLCLLAGLMYGGMRIYRRRFGQLESQEQMTTLHLTGD